VPPRTVREAEPMSQPHACPAPILGCIEALDRCQKLLDSLAPSEFAESQPGHASIGAHMRHCLDHFTCLRRGLDTGTVNYDARDRDATLEESVEGAHAVIVETRLVLERLSTDDMHRELNIRQLAAPQTEPLLVKSTSERELIFVSSHTIHHLALMLAVAETIEASAPRELGLAFSTEAYRAERAAQG
jgi:DinB family protein